MSIKFKVGYITPVGKDLYVVNTGEWRYQRPVTDKSRCRKCGYCWLICPTSSRQALATHYDTNLDYCKGCGLCARECPARAIRMVDEVQE